jgi:hypothetical protein
MGGMLSLCNVKLLSNITVFVNKLNKLFYFQCSYYAILPDNTWSIKIRPLNQTIIPPEGQSWS